MKPVRVEFSCGHSLPITEVSNDALRSIVNGQATFELEQPGEDPHIAVAIAATLLKERSQ